MLVAQLLSKNINIFTLVQNKLMILKIFDFIKFLDFVNELRQLMQLSQKMAGEIFFKYDFLKYYIKNGWKTCSDFMVWTF